MQRRIKPCLSLSSKHIFNLNHKNILQNIKIGDIAGVENKSFLEKLQGKLMSPNSKWMHFFIIGEYIPLEDDFIILESIPSHGVATGRLSWYYNDSVTIFRPKTAKDIGQKAVWQATKFGRSKYDYSVILYITWTTFKKCLWHLYHNGYFGCHYDEFENKSDKNVICTELVREAYRDLFDIFDNRYLPLPCNFKNSIGEGKIIKIGEW